MNSQTLALRHTPLWPAGHLPLKGGDYARRRNRPISPLEGEMAGRPEGGIYAPRLKPLHQDGTT
jgi:hypothetical protein